MPDRVSKSTPEVASYSLVLTKMLEASSVPSLVIVKVAVCPSEVVFSFTVYVYFVVPEALSLI